MFLTLTTELMHCYYSLALQFFIYFVQASANRITSKFEEFGVSETTETELANSE